MWKATNRNMTDSNSTFKELEVGRRNIHIINSHFAPTNTGMKPRTPVLTQVQALKSYNTANSVSYYLKAKTKKPNYFRNPHY